VQSNGYKAVYKYAKVSPKKVMPVLSMMRKQKVDDAVKLLTFDATKASKMVLKTLKSALANARNRGMDENLIVVSATADTAPTVKRGRPGSRSHFSRLLKRSTHITVCVDKEGK